MFASKDVFLTPPSGGYTIARSVRLRSSASAYLNRTPASAGNRKTWTWSGWIKRGLLGSAQRILFSSATGTTDATHFWIGFADNFGGDELNVQVWSGSLLQLPMRFRDPAAWYHIVVQFDTTQATQSNRIKVYVNGQLQAPTINQAALNTDYAINSTQAHGIGYNNYLSGSGYFDGYLTEINFIDGQALTPSSFGSTNALTGVWQPAKYTGTYGTNGFYLNFSSNGTSAALGTDFSGNSNTWTVNNISVTAGTTYDSMTDVPTLTSATQANYAVLNPLNKDPSQTLSDGNLTYTGSASLYGKVNATFGMSSGKWYWEATLTGGGGPSNATTIGIATAQSPLNASPGDSGDAYGWGYYSQNGNKYNNGTGTAYGASYAATDVIGITFDADAGTLTFYKNNSSQGTAYTGLTSGPYFPSVGDFATTSYPIWAFNFGQRPFTYTPPTGYVALNTYNLPTSTITNGAAYMAATTYTGNGGTLAVSNAVNGISFQPDLVWIKNRSTAGTDNVLVDSVRGTNGTTYYRLFSDLTNAESANNANSVSSLNSNGFTVIGTSPNLDVNENAKALVGWQWKAGTTSSSNTNGSITSTVSVGATQGFSVVTATSPASAGTVGHGLGVTPNMIIFKDRTNGSNYWLVWHSSFASATQGYMVLNTTAAYSTSVNAWNNTAPTSTTFSTPVVGTGPLNSGDTFVAYCFAAVKGFSAFGSYTGNGSTDGPFIYCGFRPRYVMVKMSSSIGDWYVFDTSRDTYNATQQGLIPNSSGTETTYTGWGDILSNGFKIRRTDAAWNTNGGTYIYACFAENPFKNALAR